MTRAAERMFYRQNFFESRVQNGATTSYQTSRGQTTVIQKSSVRSFNEILMQILSLFL
jgi:hypothetical protein